MRRTILIIATLAAALTIGCGSADDDAAPGGRPTLPQSETTDGAGATATLEGEPFIAVRTLPANALSAERLESVGEAQDAAGAPIAMARASASGVTPWELVSAAPEGWRVWRPAAVIDVLEAAGAGATIAEAESMLWPNTCLGAADPGEVCAEVITPGYRIVIEKSGDRIEYHTDLTGNVRTLR